MTEAKTDKTDQSEVVEAELIPEANEPEPGQPSLPVEPEGIATTENSKLAVNTASMVPVTAGGILIRNLDELLGFAARLVKDGAAPKKWTVGQVIIAIQAGQQVGLGLLGGLQQGAVINGIFSWRGQAAVALIQNSPKCRPGTLDFGCRGGGDLKEGWARAWRVGYPSPSERTFSVSDARRAGLWTKEGPWHDYPDGQLGWRAVGLLARTVFPDVLGGFPLAEEAVDFDEKPKLSPARPELPPPTHDPLMDAIAGKPDADTSDTDNTDREAVEAELVPDGPVDTNPGNACEHGVLVGDECAECDVKETAQ